MGVASLSDKFVGSMNLLRLDELMGAGVVNVDGVYMGVVGADVLMYSGAGEVYVGVSYTIVEDVYVGVSYTTVGGVYVGVSYTTVGGE